MSRTRGLTLVELLVVLAIIGVLIALLLPAVQSARESGRRMVCVNNLRQLGVALHSHHAAHGSFPPGQTEVEVHGEWISHGWVPFILAYLEQPDVANRYRFNESWDSHFNDDRAGPGPGRTFIKTLTCPSAPNRSGGVSAGNTRKPLDYPATNLWIGSDNSELPLPTSDSTSGVLGHNIRRRIAEIIDGTSSTLVLAECAGRNQLWVMGKFRSENSPGGAWSNPAAVNVAVEGFNPAGAAEPPENNIPGACAVNCINYQEVYAFHPSGANTLFADGAVHLLKAKLGLDVIVKAITYNGGEVLPPDLF
jgi:prepilin-type N-terminal cleavage/methylation domain-containing protein/prepilin-type processing-associated H-X9-DG protein